MNKRSAKVNPIFIFQGDIPRASVLELHLIRNATRMHKSSTCKNDQYHSKILHRNNVMFINNILHQWKDITWSEDISRYGYHNSTKQPKYITHTPRYHFTPYSSRKYLNSLRTILYHTCIQDITLLLTIPEDISHTQTNMKNITFAKFSNWNQLQPKDSTLVLTQYMYNVSYIYHFISQTTWHYAHLSTDPNIL